MYLRLSIKKASLGLLYIQDRGYAAPPKRPRHYSLKNRTFESHHPPFLRHRNYRGYELPIRRSVVGFLREPVLRRGEVYEHDFHYDRKRSYL